jgi:hypothetical protein
MFNYSDPTLQETITMLAQNEAPILKAGTYRLDNFTAFGTKDSAPHTHTIS